MNIQDIINHPNWGRQVELEAEMRGMGIERYRSSVSKNIERKQETRSKPVARIMTSSHEKMVDAINEFVKDAKTGAGRRHAALKYIELINDIDLVAHLSIRVILDGVSSRHPLMTTAQNIASALEDEVNSRRFYEAMPKAHAKFLKKAEKESLARRRWSHLLYPAKLLGVELEEWPERDKHLLGIKLVELFKTATGLIDVHHVPGDRGTVLVVEANADTLAWIAQESSRIEGLSPMFLPTIIPPKPWTTPRDGGYWTRHIRKLTLVKTQNGQYLEELADRDMPEVYGAVNALQNTAWQINTRVLDVLETLWQSNSPLGDLPLAEDMPLPPKPYWMNGEKHLTREEMTEEQREEFLAWKAKASETHVFNARMKGRRLHFQRLLWVARRFRDEDTIYFPHQVDWRGRAYPVPLYLHPQGNDLQRGLLTFASTVPIKDEEDARWLAIHGAGLWGVDKVSMDERVEWVEQHEREILAAAENPYDNRFWTQADKPWCALAFCFEWAGFKAEGYGYASSLPIQMDGTCNGLQNFSAMLLDEVGGKAVNLVPGEKPSDIYQMVADVVNQMIEADLSNDQWLTRKVEHADGTIEEVKTIQIKTLAGAWYGHVNRKVTKRPVMTLAYGARQFGFVSQVEEDTVKPWRQENAETYPFVLVGHDGQRKDFGAEACQYLGKLIWNSVGQVVIAARAAMDWLQKAARVAAKEGLPVMWTTPTGFLVQQSYRVPNVKVLETTFEKVRIQPKYAVGLGKIDSRRQASGISPNWVHSLDASHLMKTINRGHQEGIRSFSMIHDSYGTHAGNAWALAQFLREEFVQMYAQVDILARFKEELEYQVTDPTAIPELPPKGNLDLNLVLESEFFFA